MLPSGNLAIESEVSDSIKSEPKEYVKPELILENSGDPLAKEDVFDKQSLFGHDSIQDGAGNQDRVMSGLKLEIESRKDKDAFFDSLAGWNWDDQIGKKQLDKAKKLRRKEEKEARAAYKKLLKEQEQQYNSQNNLLQLP